jgi:predicted dehydrogenase
MDINIYNIHFILGIFGDPQNISYFANKHKNGIDTSGILILEYPDFISTCIGCKDVLGENFVQIQGEKGYIYVEKGSNGCAGFRLILNDGKTERYDIQDKENILYYEIVEFKRIYEEQEYETCYELLEHTKAVIRIATVARRNAGIIFEADKGSIVTK